MPQTPTPTVIRHYKRGNRVGMVIDVSGEFYFQVYDVGTSRNHNGTTELIYSHPYSSFDNKGDRMGANDHFLIWQERGNF